MSTSPGEEPRINGTADSGKKPATLEELADALRPVVVIGGQEYIGDPDLASAQAAFEGSSAPTVQGWAPTKAATSDSSDGLESRSSAYIINGDDRSYLGSSRTNYPYRTVAHFQMSDGSWCTGTMIGPHSAATAAHCIRKANGTWTGTLISGDPGNSTCSGPGDCKSFACTNGICESGFIPAFDPASPSVPYGSYFSGYSYVPNGWTGGNYQYDYAFIDFTPNSNPGNTVGWMGLVDINTGTMRMAGYPQDKNAGHEMWYKTGSITNVTSTRYQHNLDTGHGDSGAALYTYLTDGYPYLVGINSTENSSCFFWSCTEWNEAVRYNSTVYSFFHSAAGNWP